MMNSSSSSRAMRADASGYEDEARGRAGQALEATRELASQALGKAGEKVRDLRYGVRDLASKSANSMGEYAQATGRYVSEQPVKSALIAAAVGAAVAALVLAMRRNRRYYY
jgi:ElaB/YqjD/DUF883 family membrane-anchored ribosome-binding protein